MPSLKDKIVAVIGASQPSVQELRLAEEVGRELARSGAVLVCGGLGGVMEAACRGMSSGGGLTIGILPGDSCETANPFVQIPIVTGLGWARNISVVKSARAVIAVASDRVIWGTDWPHSNIFASGHTPNDGDLVDLLAAFAPDQAVRTKILVDNPAALYGFQ